jgi:K+-sensing histidine kinase KdpD
VAVFYVWPVIAASMLLPPWASYAAAAASSALYVAMWLLEQHGLLVNYSTIAGGSLPHRWLPLTVALHVTVLLLLAFLAGRLSHALTGANTELAKANAETEEQLQKMTVVNQQLRTLGESSRLFLRHLEVDQLVPEALRHIASVVGIHAGFLLLRNANTGEDDEKARVGSIDAALVRHFKELGVDDLSKNGARLCVDATDARLAKMLKAVERAGLHGFLVVPLEAKEDHLGLVCLMFVKTEAVDDVKLKTVSALADQVALVVRNIQYNDELRRMNDELTHLDQLKSDFMATMSHELRTPLTSIIGYSDMLLSGMTGELNDKQTTFVDSILKGGESLLNLINDVLDLTKIEAGRLELNPEPVDLRAALLSVLPVIKPRAAD